MTELDHLVLATPDLAATVAWFSERTGVEPSEGGPHVGMGTRNALAALGDGVYLEIIGPDLDQPAPDNPRPFGVDDLDDAAVVSWCVRGERLDRLVAAANAAGHDLADPFSMSRQAPGGVLRWNLAVPVDTRTVGVLPFAIDWGDTVHPSTTAAAGVTLADLRLESATPDIADRVLWAMGLPQRTAPAEVDRIVVELTTPRGVVALPAI